MGNKPNLDLIKDLNVSQKYLYNRNQVLNYTNQDMNLNLDNDDEVYIAVFDIPIESGILSFQTQSLALVYGLNTHLYHGSGSAVIGLEKREDVLKAMGSVLISSHQVLPFMELVNDTDFYNSKNVRVYLKTAKGIYFKELKNKEDKIDRFLLNLMNYVLNIISKTGGIEGEIQ